MSREDLLITHANAIPSRVAVAGTFLRQQGVNRYRCPVCRNEFRHDDEYAPACTGPGALDTHPMTVMTLVGVVEPVRLILP